MDFMKNSALIKRDAQDMYKVFCESLPHQDPKDLKPLKLIGAPFNDGLVIPQCKHLFSTQSAMQVFLSDYLPVKSIKISAAKSQDYFVRLKDDLAHIHKDILQGVM